MSASLWGCCAGPQSNQRHTRHSAAHRPPWRGHW